MAVSDGAKLKLKELRRARRSMAMTAAEIMTVEEVAELLRMRPSTVQDFARRGLLPSIKLGRSRRFVRSDIEAEIQRQRASSA